MSIDERVSTLKLRHKVAMGAFALWCAGGLAFLLPEVNGYITLAPAFVGLAVWAFMTLKDPGRTNYETFVAWFALPSILMAVVLDLFFGVGWDSTGLTAALFLACIFIPFLLILGSVFRDWARPPANI